MKNRFFNFIFKTLSRILILALFSSCSTTPISGNKAFLLTTPENENQQGEEAYREILSKEKVVTDTKEAKMVSAIGQQIAAIAKQDNFKWEFKTLESDTANAFCLPGGKVAVYTGLFKYAKNEAGLATVMGHEIGHAIARHGGQRMAQAMATDIALAGVAALGLSKMDPDKKNLAMAALGVGATVGIVLPFSRANETEADEIGLTLMARAGYDPNEAIQFWDRFSEAGGQAPLTFLSTHPQSSKRKEHLQSLLAKALTEYETSVKRGKGQEF